MKAAYAAKFNVIEIRKREGFTAAKPTTRVSPLPVRNELGRPINGKVFVTFIVASDGRVIEPLVLNSTDKRLTLAAVAAIRQWRFTPARLNGSPISSIWGLPATFEDSMKPSFTVAPSYSAANGVRVKVALLDGEPVYHWCVFKSAYSDDVDRALVLRDFKRRGFTLPEHFVEEQLQSVIAKNFNGDKAAFDDKLKRSGASITKYKQFLAEEITLAAMPRFIAKHSNQPDSPAARAKWIAALRKNAKVTLLQ